MGGKGVTMQVIDRFHIKTAGWAIVPDVMPNGIAVGAVLSDEAGNSWRVDGLEMMGRRPVSLLLSAGSPPEIGTRLRLGGEASASRFG